MLRSDICKKGRRKTTTNFLKHFINSNIYQCLFFQASFFLLILSYDDKQERAVMSDAAEILKSVKMPLIGS